jgi:hemoglobin-like flavoprotein
MLSREQIELVQNDWSKVASIADAAATIFYERLFELDPKLKALFKSDLTEQKKKLMQTIGVAVKGLDDTGSLIPAVQSLGRRHVGYGVKPDDYDTVGVALLFTLRQGLGVDFDPQHEAAWAKVYGLLARTMIGASAEFAAASPALAAPSA